MLGVINDIGYTNTEGIRTVCLVINDIGYTNTDGIKTVCRV
jgi:hypothetical protein